MRLHLADCPACRGQLALLSRLESGGQKNQAPSDLARTRALNLVRTQRFPVRPAWAAVAILLLALGLAWQWPSQLPAEVPIPAVEQTRVAQPTPDRGQALMPSIKQASGGQDLHVEWQTVDSALYYDVNLVSKSGDLLSTLRVERNQLTLSQRVTDGLEMEFYVRVDAWLSASRKLSSDHVLVQRQDAR